MCEEESEDTEAVAKLFEINDSINRTVERYKLFKKGDIDGANRIPQGTLGKSGAGVSKGPDNSLNLIDFGDPEPTPEAAQPSTGAPAQPASKGNALEDDLLGLSLGGTGYGQSGSISLGGSNGSGQFTAPVKTPSNALSVLGLSGGGSQSQSQYQNAAQSINDLFGSSNSGPSSKPASPLPPVFSQPPPQPARSTPDPFAALNSPAPRQVSPMQFQQSIKQQPTGSGAIDLLGDSTFTAPAPAHPAPTSNLAQSSTAAANDDDEWNFTSAVPDITKEITVNNTSINVVFTVSRETDSVILIRSRISNNTPSPVSDLTFQVAASKVRP